MKSQKVVPTLPVAVLDSETQDPAEGAGVTVRWDQSPEEHTLIY